MLRTDIINKLIKGNNYKVYLEIGVFDKELNFNKIECESKYWCDPKEEVSKQPSFKSFKNEIGGYCMGSDEMFELLGTFSDKRKTFDIIFIDGLHLAEQVKKDLDNSIKHLSENGVIVVHDCNPLIEDIAKEEWILSEWCGTVWKGFIEWRYENISNYEIFTVDTDYGVGVVYKKPYEFVLRKSILEPDTSYFPKFLAEKLDWNYFDENRKDLLNLISVETFLKLNSR